MNYSLKNKQIVLGVTGGIAAYKSADIVRRLREAGAIVQVIMTEHAKQFITPLTLQAVSGYPVHDDLFDLKAEAAMGHIALARWADAIIIAPASANFMARMLQGEASDLLTTVCLTTKAPIALAPAMNQAMWKNTSTQENVQALQAKGVLIFGPAEGSQACGDTGFGRMLEPIDIVEKLGLLFQAGRFAGKKVLLTAGPTHEAIDPVRFISNGSSGKMGYALAEALVEEGAEVILVSGPVSIPQPSRMNIIHVTSAMEMLNAVMEQVSGCDVFFSVAAVADYRCKTIASQKIPKNEMPLTLQLERNPDIVATVANLPKRPYVIGFAAETKELLAHAKAKLLNKKMDMIIANLVGEGVGIGSDENAVMVLWGDERRELPLMSKAKLSREIIKLVAKIFFNADKEPSS